VVSNVLQYKQVVTENGLEQQQSQPGFETMKQSERLGIPRYFRDAAAPCSGVSSLFWDTEIERQTQRFTAALTSVVLQSDENSQAQQLQSFRND
jgi:hypothetical protein